MLGESVNRLIGNPDLGSEDERVGISDVLPCMNRMIRDLEDKGKAAEDPQLRFGIQAGLKKAKRYYHILCRSKPYIIATFLDPRRNGNWFITHAFPDDEEMQAFARETISDAFRAWYEELGKAPNEKSASAYSHATWPLPPSTAPNRSASSRNYEFKAYLESPLIDHYVDVFKFWKEKEGIWPVWAAMAFAYLSIPTMSAEVERVFSRHTS